MRGTSSRLGMAKGRKTIASQGKRAERCADIPPDEWLNSSKVHNSKKKHLKLLDLLEVDSEGKRLILDAGCGPGTYGIILAEQENVRVLGVDISKTAIRKAQDRTVNKRDFDPIEGDLEFLPLKDATFDVVFVGWTLHHFPSLETVCRELCRVLKPGGTIAVVEPNEANLAMQVSRLVEDVLSRVILKIGWDTLNRATHTYENYIQELERCGFVDLKYSSCYASLPPIPSSRSPAIRGVLGLIYHLRALLFSLSMKVLSPPLNGPDLLISAVKTGALNK